jgi:hypothetical protein
VSDAADLTAELGPVRDQGARGTCLSFAVTAAHEQARRLRRGTLPADLGEEILYWACKQVDGEQESGTYPQSAAQALTETGQSAGNLWPYDGTRDDTSPTYAPPSQALKAPEMRRASISRTEADLENLRGLLRTAHAVVLALELWPQFYANHRGALIVPSASDLLGEGHAVALVGFDDQTEELLLRNSWGDSWGEDGNGRLPYAALTLVCRGAWVLEDEVDT